MIGLLLCALSLPEISLAAEPRSVSGIYPHLATFNEEGECGTRPMGRGHQTYCSTREADRTSLPDSFGAYWLRLIADKDTTATATFLYE